MVQKGSNERTETRSEGGESKTEDSSEAVLPSPALSSRKWQVLKASAEAGVPRQPRQRSRWNKTCRRAKHTHTFDLNPSITFSLDPATSPFIHRDAAHHKERLAIGNLPRYATRSLSLARLEGTHFVFSLQYETNSGLGFPLHVFSSRGKEKSCSPFRSIGLALPLKILIRHKSSSRNNDKIMGRIGNGACTRLITRVLDLRWGNKSNNEH